MFCMVIEIFTIIGSCLAVNLWVRPDYMQGFYMGVGSGITAGSVVLWLRYQAMLKNEKKLKENGIALLDERNKEISSAALWITALVMLTAAYIIALIGGIWSPEVTKCVISLFSLFIAVYFISYRFVSLRN